MGALRSRPRLGYLGRSVGRGGGRVSGRGGGGGASSSSCLGRDSDGLDRICDARISPSSSSNPCIDLPNPNTSASLYISSSMAADIFYDSVLLA